jgi:hypothetical protein
LLHWIWIWIVQSSAKIFAGRASDLGAFLHELWLFNSIHSRRASYAAGNVSLALLCVLSWGWRRGVNTGLVILLWHWLIIWLLHWLKSLLGWTNAISILRHRWVGQSERTDENENRGPKHRQSPCLHR